MKSIALIIAVAGLTACSTTMADSPPAESASAESIAGQYRVVRADGSSYISVINDDGTYSEVENGVTRETGRWQRVGEQTCYDPDGPAGRLCYSFSAPTEPAEPGTFLARSEKGDVFTVRKIEKK